MSLKLNAIITLPDGRVGTICYRFLDGEGGVWGRHEFRMPDCGFGDELPKPQFMLRDPSLQPRFDAECVGESYEVAA